MVRSYRHFISILTGPSRFDDTADREEGGRAVITTRYKTTPHPSTFCLVWRVIVSDSFYDINVEWGLVTREAAGFNVWMCCAGKAAAFLRDSLLAADRAKSGKHAVTPVGRCIMHACMQLEAANAAQRYGQGSTDISGNLQPYGAGRTMACSRGKGLSRNTDNTRNTDN